MRKFLLSLLSLLCIVQYTFAQPATYSNPIGLGRGACGAGGSSTDSLYYLNYLTPNLSNSATPIRACKPVLRTNFAPLSGYSAANRPFSIFNASVAFNPADQKIYYVWTDYNVPSPYKSYIWRWDPTTCPTPAAPGLDTLKTFNTDIGGITFDANGIGWQLEFVRLYPTGPYRGMLRQVDFNTGIVGIPDTLDYTGGKTLWNVGTGDITITPSGQMYFVFNNKLFTPDYGSAGGPTKHITCTYIDTVRLPAGKTGLPGLAFGSGDLIASYSPGTGCVFKRIDGITGDTASITYTYALNKGIYSTDMSQINSGIGPAKKLISVTATGTAKQYDVVYDVYTRNFGNVPLTNVQVTDNLGAINGPFNVSNVTAAFTSNPAGVLLNPAYNGTTVTSLLLAGQNLPCYPVANNNFTIRISCRLSNIDPGVVYNNSAVATANGFKNVAVRDSSTNGSSPDLNQNDKTDDVGEGQPTPFIIILTPALDPCIVLGTTMYTQTFGAGIPLANTLPAAPSASTTYTGAAAQPLGLNTFTLADTARKGDNANWVRRRDHTGNVNGRMLLVNADAAARYFYRDTINVLCPAQQYSLSFYASFVGNAAYKTVCDGLGGFKYSRVKCRIRDATTGLVITEASTAFITDSLWTQYGIKWVMPAGYTGVIFELINDAPGGCGNDLAIDDITFGTCSAAPTVSVNSVAGCIGGSSTFTSALSDSTALPGTKDFQWQWSPAPGAGPWTNIGGATSATYTINPVVAADTGRFYRVIIAATGNIGVAGCQYIAPGLKLSGKAPSTPAATATRNKNNICPGISVGLGLTGGTLGSNAKWKWYTGASCGTTLIDSGSSITVTPLVTTTYYVRAEGDCNTTTCQQVTVTISCDIDKDDDGIPDFVESNIPAAITNGYNTLYPGYKDYNNDFINDDFQADGDSDNDGTPNYLDPTFPGRVDSNGDLVDDRFDLDLDGKINMLDLDSDNDGVPDVVEAYGADTDGDGKIDSFTDTDGDGLSQNVDVNATGANNSGTGLGIPNLDGDAIANFLDLDSDNDGIPDLVEAGGTDADNNGKVDGVFVDANADGLHDSYITGTGTALLITGTDINADGRADSYPNKNLDRDFRPNAYDMDSDGDGIVDVIEAGLTDADLDGIADGVIGTNGWSTTVSALPALNLRNTDAFGNPDYLDIDSDDDGIPDNIEGMSTAGYALPTTTDADGDGLMSPYDNQVGFGGAGIFLYDHDGDGTPDYRDLDTDGDGSPDAAEGNDWNLNGYADENVTLTGLDTDGDGLDNRFDSLNSVTNVKGTSYMMGTGGTLTGDATPGTKATVQKKTVAQINRDWRFVGVVLPVQFINFGAIPDNIQVFLNWTIITPKEIDHFEIERSIDNATYTKTGIVTGTGKLNEQQSFAFTDDISGIGNDIIYYRIKVVGKAGEIMYTNVLVVRRNQTKTPVTIMPNPANDYVLVRFFVEKESEVTLRLVDNIGKTVLFKKQKVAKGNNTIQLNDLEKYSNGVYSLQILVNDEVVTQKLILSK
ncbi:T9SS type A sorting domain-containing protein [Ferruginibacter sp.]|nr:T9SS type A sorting domain-containing protein [Ferruginibacter sp.]